LGNRVNLLALAGGDGQGFDRANSLEAVGDRRIDDLTSFVGVAALGAVNPEGFRGGVFEYYKKIKIIIIISVE